MGDGGGDGGPGGIGAIGQGFSDAGGFEGVGVGQGEPGGPGNIGGIGAQGMSGAMAGGFGPGAGGPDGGGPAGYPGNRPFYQNAPQAPPIFQIPANQVQNDMTPWGQQYQQPQMNPINYQQQAPPIDMRSFFSLFGGK